MFFCFFQSVSSLRYSFYLGGAAIGLSVICAPFVAPAFRKHCLPFVPATTNQIYNILKLLKTSNRNEKLLDIGSGDGRIVIGKISLNNDFKHIVYTHRPRLFEIFLPLAAAKHGLVQAHGVEYNPWLVQYSRFSSLYHGVFSKTKFFKKDLWKFDVSKYNIVVIFGVESMMNDLEQKLLNEASIDTKIIACRFPLPNLEVTTSIGEGIDTVWLYELKKT